MSDHVIVRESRSTTRLLLFNHIDARESRFTTRFLCLVTCCMANQSRFSFRHLGFGRHLGIGRHLGFCSEQPFVLTLAFHEIWRPSLFQRKPRIYSWLYVTFLCGNYFSPVSSNFLSLGILSILIDPHLEVITTNSCATLTILSDNQRLNNDRVTINP